LPLLLQEDLPPLLPEEGLLHQEIGLHEEEEVPLQEEEEEDNIEVVLLGVTDLLLE